MHIYLYRIYIELKVKILPCINNKKQKKCALEFFSILAPDIVVQ